MVFENRKEAGKMLASKLLSYKNKQPVILALPRGGVSVGFEVAKALHATLDVLVVRKIGSPLV
jgi:putative phosphoribosyl transferase